MASILPTTAAAQPCGSKDFEIKNTRVEVVSKCRNNKCPRVVFAGNLVNNCAVPSSAKIRIVIYDHNHSPLEVMEDWTTAPNNLAPGASYPFVRRSEIYSDAMASYTMDVVETKAW